MENNVHLIQKDIDGQKGWKPHNNYQFVANKQFLPVGLTELSALLPIYPLGILRVATGAAKLVAIVGREAERNLFVAPDGRWTAPYMPQVVQMYPFVMVPASKDAKDQYSLAIQAQSGLMVEAPDTTKGEARFFEDDGQPTAAMQAVIARFQAHMHSEKLADAAVTALVQQDLLKPWPGSSAPAEGAQAAGLFQVDEQKLNALPPEALKALQDAHALALAYAQLLSMGRMEVLHRLAALYAAQAQKSHASAAATAPKQVNEKDIQDLLEKNETLSFG